MKEILGNFLEYIQFHKIPANVLMREIHPLGLVPYSIIMNALAYQVSSLLIWSLLGITKTILSSKINNNNNSLASFDFFLSKI